MGEVGLSGGKIVLVLDEGLDFIIGSTHFIS